MNREGFSEEEINVLGLRDGSCECCWIVDAVGFDEFVARRVATALLKTADDLPALTEGADRAGTWTFLPHDRDIYSLAIEEAQVAVRSIAGRVTA